MSEALPNLPEAPPTPPPRDATSLLLVRPGAQGQEVFWVQRGKALAFFGSFRAFPGGKVDKADAQAPLPGLAGPEAALVACAVRELFEETGVLLARGAERLGPERRQALRTALLEDQLTLSALLASEGLSLDPGLLTPAGRWVTPGFLAVRFDARMFLVDLPPGEQAEVWPGELASGEWIAPARALERWAAGETLLHPPNLNALRAVAQAGSRADLLARLRNPPEVVDFIADRIEFQQGFRLFPLRTPTLPPATHTNCYVLGNGELLVVDPGSPDPAEQARLVGFLRRLMAEGARPRAVLLTHHHGDHVGGVEALRKELGLELWCHPETASRVGKAERLLEEGAVLELAGAPALRLEVLHTPGHARGHLCLYHRPSKALVCGDMVAGQSTIIIDPPEGNMGQYLASLRRLHALPVGTLYQSHGAPIAEGPAKLEEYLAHRQLRIDALYAALEAGELGLPALVEQVYADTPAALHPIAERSALASLEYLLEQGRVVRRGERFARA